MNILFITLCNFSSIHEKNIYTDLLRQFSQAGHQISVMSPDEGKTDEQVRVITENNVTIYKIKVGVIQKTNVIHKGINMLRMQSAYKKAYSTYLDKGHIDVVLFSTPPITLDKVLNYIKRRKKVFVYLLLKDIFPQNAVDLQMFSARGLIYRYFRYREKQIYKVSDYIGCMSQANVDYVLKHNSYLSLVNVGESPNCLEIGAESDISPVERKYIREQYGIPVEKRVFIYGGNLGKPQDIPYIIECLRAVGDESQNYFIICGSGTEYHKLERFIKDEGSENVKLLSSLPRQAYDDLVKACDVGLIFLDHRFTIPNFPSRILSYMECGLPILASTDKHSDVGQIIEQGEFGWWCSSDSVEGFVQLIAEIDKFSDEEIEKKGKNGRRFLEQNYDVKVQYAQILEVVNGKERV